MALAHEPALLRGMTPVAFLSHPIFESQPTLQELDAPAFSTLGGQPAPFAQRLERIEVHPGCWSDLDVDYRHPMAPNHRARADISSQLH
ncbi:hypothetical protein BTE54_20140 [Agrobacterium sp. YIC 4121]|nr:hypothetical protein BTE54_20140 [Agrobacterium sp. YIC 4121]